MPEMLFENSDFGFEKASSGVTLSTQSRASDRIKRNGRLSKIHENSRVDPKVTWGFFLENPKVPGTLGKKA